MKLQPVVDLRVNTTTGEITHPLVAGATKYWYAIYEIDGNGNPKKLVKVAHSIKLNPGAKDVLVRLADLPYFKAIGQKRECFSAGSFLVQSGAESEDPKCEASDLAEFKFNVTADEAAKIELMEPTPPPPVTEENVGKMLTEFEQQLLPKVANMLKSEIERAVAGFQPPAPPAPAPATTPATPATVAGQAPATTTATVAQPDSPWMMVLRTLLILVFIVVIAGICYGGYKLLRHGVATNPAQASNSAATTITTNGCALTVSSSINITGSSNSNCNIGPMININPTPPVPKPKRAMKDVWLKAPAPDQQLVANTAQPEQACPLGEPDQGTAIPLDGYYSNQYSKGGLYVPERLVEVQTFGYSPSSVWYAHRQFAYNNCRQTYPAVEFPPPIQRPQPTHFCDNRDTGIPPLPIRGGTVYVVGNQYLGVQTGRNHGSGQWHH